MDYMNLFPKQKQLRGHFKNVLKVFTGSIIRAGNVIHPLNFFRIKQW